MKNITFSADETLIERARTRAKAEERTLNEAFRDWLAVYGRPRTTAQEYDSLMNRLGKVNAGRKFSREEMNER